MEEEKRRIVSDISIKFNIQKRPETVNNIRHTDYSDFEKYEFYLEKFYDKKEITVPYEYYWQRESRNCLITSGISTTYYYQEVYTKKPIENII